MLNRRILRVKVMQSLYGVQQAKLSNYHLGLEELAEVFAPDLMSPEKQDLVKLDQLKKQASSLYESFFEKQDNAYLHQDPVITKAITNAINNYHNANTGDIKHFQSMLLSDVLRVEELYKLILFSLSRLAHIADDDAKEGIHTVVQNTEPDYFYKLKYNPFLLAIERSKTLRAFVEKHKLNPPVDLLKTAYKKFIKKDDVYKEYQKLPSTDIDKDRDIILHLVKTHLLKNEQLVSYWEEQDYNWSENDDAIRSLILKTIKGITDPAAEDFVLPSLSPNWEDDKEFMLDLYKEAMLFDEEGEKLISDKVQNWDMERLAMMDRIILKMALTEMVKFPNIPVKVTINEYIELSKSYSTPKSKQFVNGLLDTLSIEMQSSGQIKKSGRGLLDNK